MHLRPFLALLSLTFLGLASVPEKSHPRANDVLGHGEQSFRWDEGWAKLPAGMGFGNTHGCIVVDEQDRVYVNTDTENAVMVFEADGTYVHSFGKELAGGLHGMAIVEEGGESFLYMTHIGKSMVFKSTLEGKILWSMGYPEESGIYDAANQYRPTSIAVGPNGDLYVADGYGKSYVHRYDKERKYISSFGGKGTEPGKMRTPHGIWLETNLGDPHLVVSDRGNQRLQRFDLEGKFLEEIKGDLRRPCHSHGFRDELVVADLDGRVTILDRKGKLLTHLGENADPALRGKNPVPPKQWLTGQFIAPHCANWDSKGNLYVMDWNATGRVNKLVRVVR